MRSFIPPLTMSFRWMTPSRRLPSHTASGVPPFREMRSLMSLKSPGTSPPRSHHELDDRVGGALAKLPSFEIDAAHPRVGRERNERRLVFRDVAAPQAIFLFRQDHDRPAFRRFIGQAGQLRCIGQFLVVDSVDRQELDCLPISQRDRAGLVEQQRVDVAGGFHCLAAHRQHIVLHHAIHAGDADGGKQPADGGRDQADQQGDQDRDGGNRSRARLRDAEHRIGLQRNHREQEDQRQARDQDVQRDLIRRLLALRALHQRDHAVEERLARVGGDLDLDLIRQDAGAARYRAAVAAGFANDRRAFSGDHRFVHGGHALDHFAVSGNQIAGIADHDVARLATRSPATCSIFRRRSSALPSDVRLGLAQSICLGLAARFRHGFGEVREQDREPEPERDLELEIRCPAPR